MKALSLWQPWAWLIFNAGKDVENRGWSTSYRGPLLIHAAKRRPSVDEVSDIANQLDEAGLEEASTRLRRAWGTEAFHLGGIVGQVELVDCVRRSTSLWAAPDRVHWKLAGAAPQEFQALRGARGLFEVYFRHLPDGRVEATTEP